MGEYKIRDLEQLTGVKAHTIRIWEKRYGLLDPSRTDSDIRLYSDEELKLLLKVSILNKNGFKISRISEMTVQEIDIRINSLHSQQVDSVYYETMLLALVEMEEEVFSKVVVDLIANHGLEVTFIEHLIPFLNKIGVMWIVGTINPAQEHFITHIIRQKLISEIDKLEFTSDKTITYILYLPENEWHELGLLFYNYVIRKSGKHTIYLGQSLPVDSLLTCIAKYHPVALVTSIVSSLDETGIVKYIGQIRTAYPDLPIFAGGYQVDLVKETLSNSIKSIDKLEVLYNLINQTEF
jgi:DNA-binding transcriptional MerR regulator